MSVNQNRTACKALKAYLLKQDTAGYAEKLRDFPATELLQALQAGVRECVFMRQAMGPEAQDWQSWQAERPFQVALFKRQTACPSDFARMYLSVSPCDAEHFELAIAPATVADTSISITGVAPDAKENLHLISGWMLGFLDGLRAQQLWGLRIILHQIWVHQLDSQPRSYYHCAYRFIQDLREQ